MMAIFGKYNLPHAPMDHGTFYLMLPSKEVSFLRTQALPRLSWPHSFLAPDAPYYKVPILEFERFNPNLTSYRKTSLN